MNNFNGLNKKIVFFISISIIVTLIGVIMAITNNLSSTNISQEENSSSSNQTENESNENEKITQIYEEGIINITNLSTYSSNSDPNTRLSAQKTLYRYATSMKSDKMEYDAIVRENTFSQSLDENLGIYTDRMIIDIPDLKQSWGLEYRWSNRNGVIIGDFVYPKCLDDSQLIYEKFECVSNYGKYES